MKVSAVANQQPCFNGYMHESVVDFVRNASLNERRRILSSRKISYEQNPLKLKEVEAMTHNIIAKLSDFFAQCHPQTYIAIEYTESGYNNCVVRNTKLSRISLRDKDLIKKSQGVDICQRAVSSTYPVTPKEEMQKSLNEKDLKLLEKFVDLLIANVQPENLDKALLSEYKEYIAQKSKKWGMGFFSKIISKILSVRANSFEKELKNT